MRVETLNPSDVPLDLWQQLSSLRDRNPGHDSPLFDPRLIQLLGRYRRDTRVVVAKKGGDPVAFWGLHVRPGGWSHPLGGPFSDWHGPVMDEQAGLSPEDLLKAADIAGMGVHGFRPASWQKAPKNARTRDMCHVSDLSMGYEHFLATQSGEYPHHFKKMRRLTRNLHKDYAEVRFEFDNRDPAALEWLFRMKAQQFSATGRHDVLRPGWARGYVDALCQQSAHDLATVVSTLSLDGQLAAAELNMRSRNVLHGWLTGYDSAFAHASPGLMLMHFLLSEMPARNLTYYDMGPGLTHYKRHYTNWSLPVETGVVRGTGRGRILDRAAGYAWSGAEARLPAPISTVMGKARRRFNQVLISEQTFQGRAAGLATAMRRPSQR